MDEDRIEIEKRLTEVEQRAKSNTHRLEEHEEEIKENAQLIGTIKELAVEMKHMRENLDETIKRLNKLESKDADKWEKFKWLIFTGIVTGVLGYFLGTLGLG